MKQWKRFRFLFLAVFLLSGGLLTGLIFTLRGTSTSAHAASPVSVFTACRWKVVASKNPGTVASFYGVAALSSTDVWAVGGYSNPGSGGPALTLAEHWNGTSWSVVSTPSPGTNQSDLFAIARVPGKNELWAVGRQNNLANGSSPIDQTLVEHWDGTSWQIVNSSNVGASNNDLYGVVAISPTDIWAVGAYDAPNSFTSPQLTLIEHWDGKVWSVVTSPSPASTTNKLEAISGSSANDIWAVGETQLGLGTTSTDTLIEHWDGTAWSVVSSPNPGSEDNLLHGIVAISANDAWAVGEFTNTLSPGQTLVEHWDGTAWNVVSSPNPGPLVNVLKSVVVVSAANVWAVGYKLGHRNPGRTLVEHWNGTTWMADSSPNGGQDYNLLEAITLVPGTNQLWAVGSHNNNTFGRTLTLVHC